MAFGETSILLVPVVTTSQAVTGEEVESYSYATSTDIPCRFFGRKLESIVRQDGQSLQVDAVAQVRGRFNIDPDALTSSEGQRRQVKVDGVLWEVAWAREMGGMGRRKEILLRRWK